MKRLESTPASISQHDYELALKSAVSWLGDRYLLADPLPKHRSERKDFFVAARRWHDVRNAKRPPGNIAR